MMVHKEVPKEMKNIKLNETKPGTLQKEHGIKPEKAKETGQFEEKYFHCLLCKIDIHQKTEVYSHLGEFFL